MSSYHKYLKYHYKYLNAKRLRGGSGSGKRRRGEEQGDLDSDRDRDSPKMSRYESGSGSDSGSDSDVWYPVDDQDKPNGNPGSIEMDVFNFSGPVSSQGTPVAPVAPAPVAPAAPAPEPEIPEWKRLLHRQLDHLPAKPQGPLLDSSILDQYRDHFINYDYYTTKDIPIITIDQNFSGIGLSELEHGSNGIVYSYGDLAFKTVYDDPEGPGRAELDSEINHFQELPIPDRTDIIRIYAIVHFSLDDIPQQGIILEKIKNLTIDDILYHNLWEQLVDAVNKLNQKEWYHGDLRLESDGRIMNIGQSRKDGKIKLFDLSTLSQQDGKNEDTLFLKKLIRRIIRLQQAKIALHQEQTMDY